MKKAYLSGKISGLPMLEVIEKFEIAELQLKAAGFEVINPVKLDHTKNEHRDWSLYMKTDLQAMLDHDCNYIYMLPCWQQSPGAKIELQLAISLGYSVIWAA
jgi:hypothetical protein